jgi:lipoprotein Spr
MKKVILYFLVIFSSAASASDPELKPDSPAIDREQQQLEWCFTYSNMLGYNITYVGNPRIYQTVNEWLGVPYKFSGNSRKGIDCSAFVCEMYRDCYSKPITGSARDLFKTVDPVRRADLREGDLVFFKIKGNRISHVGIYLGENKFAHASSGHGVTVSDLDDPYYLKYYFKGGRLKE